MRVDGLGERQVRDRKGSCLHARAQHAQTQLAIAEVHPGCLCLSLLRTFYAEGLVDNRTFLVSMVHQMHCLDAFRVGFATNRTGYAHHVEHCLRYMLQIVLCNADTTLEADEPGMRGGQWEHAAGGVGSVHQCRDWRVLREYLDEHPAGPVRL